MIFGIVKEPEPEKRVVITPDVLKAIIDMKVQVLVEKSAGQKAFYSDEEYIEAGGLIVSRKEVFEKANILLKINPFAEEETKLLKSEQILVASFNPFHNYQIVNALMKKKITSFSMELIPRTSRAQLMDVLSSTATVAGYEAVLDAALHLPRFFPMFMSASGTVKPAKVLVLGAGVAGLQAVATARRLGAVVEVFDVRSAVKDEVKSLGAKFIEVEGAVEDAQAGGYAIEQKEEFKMKQATLIHEHAIRSDVIICTAQIPGKKAPVLIYKNTISNMKPGAVIIDMAASSGGNCELTKNGEIIRHNQVIIKGKSDYPSNMPMDASRMYAKNMLNFLKLLIDGKGSLTLDFDDEIIKNTCLTHAGELINERIKSFLQTA
jgi:NAD(P) transhydrogenase subunit alpha